jgi:hypothetical protein
MRRKEGETTLRNGFEEKNTNQNQPLLFLSSLSITVNSSAAFRLKFVFSSSVYAFFSDALAVSWNTPYFIRFPLFGAYNFLNVSWTGSFVSSSSAFAADRTYARFDVRFLPLCRAPLQEKLFQTVSCGVVARENIRRG